MKKEVSKVKKSRGRPNKYFTHIEPKLKQIEEMCQTMTEKQMADSLGVAYSSWKLYKNKYSAFSDALKKGRENLVVELKSVLIKKAKGFNYQEVQTIEEDGKIVRKVTFQKASLPDVAALNLLLKNYDKDNWANDPQMLKIREKELELKERQIENNEW